jgi:hypothetical protein
MHNTNHSANGHLLAALPAFIGYYPSEALVIVAVTAADDDKYLFGNVMVQDLTTMAAEPTSSARAFLGAFGNEPILKVIGIIVTDRPHDLADLPLRRQVNDFTSVCRTAGRQSIEFAYLPRFSAGATWIGYCHAECRGTLPDPATSPSAFSLALEGYQIHENRDALAALFARAPESERAGIERLVATAATAVRAEDRAGDVIALRARLGRLDSAISKACEGALPHSDEHLADLISAFASYHISMALIAVAGQTKDAAPAGNLLLHLLRLAPTAEGRQIAAVLAAVSYVRGNGTWARLAAEAINPPANLSSLIMAGLHAGAPHAETARVLLDHAHNARRMVMNSARS